MMRHHRQEEAAAQQKSYIGGSVGGGGSSTVVETGTAGVSYNGIGQVSGGVYESCGPVQKFQPNLHGISMEWTQEEQAILEDGQIQYASESNMVRYAKIAVQLKNKTVRDVALRCKWIAKRDFSKRRKPDLNLAGKGRLKEKSSDPSVISNHATIHQDFGAYSQGGINGNHDSELSYSAIGGLTGTLLQQNAQVFQLISANLATHQIQENIGLFCRARDNILQILNILSDPPNIMKRMPPLPVKIDEGLLNSYLPPTAIQIQR